MIPGTRAALAALSPLVASSLDIHTDALVLPGVSTSAFLNLVHLLAEEQEEGAVAADIIALVHLLGVAIFQDSDTFEATLKRSPQTLEAWKPGREPDPFAPGYTSQAPTTSAEDNIKTEGKQSDHHDLPDRDSDEEFIDDEDAASEDEVWGEEVDERPKSKRVKESVVQEWGEAVVVGEEVEEPPHTLDTVVAPWLKCHHCHQVGSSVQCRPVQKLLLASVPEEECSGVCREGTPGRGSWWTT